MALDLDKLNIVIEGESDKAAAAVDALIKKLRSLRETTEKLTNVTSQVRKTFRDIANAAKAASRETIKYEQNLAATATVESEVQAEGEAAASAIIHLGTSSAQATPLLEQTAESLKALSREMRYLSDNSIVPFSGLAKAAPTGGNVKQLTGEVWDIYDAEFSVAEEADRMSDAWKNFDNTILMLDAPGKIEDFGHQLHTDAELTKSVLRSLGGIFGGTFKNMTSKIGALASQFGRIAKLRLMRWVIRELVQSVKEGLQILIDWDREYRDINGNTSHAAKTVDELSAKWREVKKAIGAAAMPLIQILQPLLNGVMNAVIGIANWLNQVLRSAQGFSTYMKATYIETSKTTKEAKELQRVLFGFDELNVLNGNGGSVSPIEFIETDIGEDSIAAKVGKILVKIKDGVKDASEFTGGQFKKAWADTVEGAKELWGHLKEGWEGLKEGVGLAADFTKTQFQEAWDKTLEGLEEVKRNWDSIKTWFENSIIIPIKQKLADLYEWLLNEHPGLAAFLGITKEKVSKMRYEISVSTATDSSTNAVLGLTNNGKGKSGIPVNINATAKLSEDVKKLISLAANKTLNIGANLVDSITQHAEGGDPVKGSLFIAGESGAELVASSPSGTGVMNMKQMQDAVSNGNVQVVSAITAAVNILSGVINSKDMNTYLDGQMITDTVVRRANSMTRATGQSVFVR